MSKVSLCSKSYAYLAAGRVVSGQGQLNLRFHLKLQNGLFTILMMKCKAEIRLLNTFLSVCVVSQSRSQSLRRKENSAIMEFFCQKTW